MIDIQTFVLLSKFTHERNIADLLNFLSLRLSTLYLVLGGKKYRIQGQRSDYNWPYSILWK